jgi:hypothetical protein
MVQYHIALDNCFGSFYFECTHDDVAFHMQLKCQNIPFPTCSIQLQWEKQLENGIRDFKMTRKITIVE